MILFQTCIITLKACQSSLYVLCTYIKIYVCILDTFARVNVSQERRRCLDGLSELEIQSYYQVTAVYAIYLTTILFYPQPEVKQNFETILQSLTLPADICEDAQFDCTDMKFFRRPMKTFQTSNHSH